MQQGPKLGGHDLGKPVAAGATFQALAGGDIAVADAEGFAEAGVGGDGAVELLQALLDGGGNRGLHLAPVDDPLAPRITEAGLQIDEGKTAAEGHVHQGQGAIGTLRRIEEESAGLDGAEGLEIDVHFADFDDTNGRHWSQRGIARLARTMHDRGRITKARKAWVKAVADVAEDCFEVQRKVLESHEARVKAAMDRARSKAKACAVTQQKPNAADRNPIELEAHHLFDAATRPDLAALEENLLVISSALHRNFHKWMGNRPCEPKDFVDYLLRNELTHFDGSPSTRARQEARQQKLIHRLELLQARYEGNRLLY